MLDSRIDALKHYDDKMNDLADELRKHRVVTGTEQTKFLSEIKKTNTEMGKVSNDVRIHIPS
mgnify:CR=1 FL=1